MSEIKCKTHGQTSENKGNREQKQTNAKANKATQALNKTHQKNQTRDKEGTQANTCDNKGKSKQKHMKTEVWRKR